MNLNPKINHIQIISYTRCIHPYQFKKWSSLSYCTSLYMYDYCDIITICTLYMELTNKEAGIKSTRSALKVSNTLHSCAVQCAHHTLCLDSLNRHLRFADFHCGCKQLVNMFLFAITLIKIMPKLWILIYIVSCMNKGQCEVLIFREIRKK